MGAPESVEGHAQESGESLGPILGGDASSDYERYLRTDQLLDLQGSPQEWRHRDELLFTTVHQVSELWLKHASFEIEGAGRLVGEGELAAANRLLRRAGHDMRLVTDSLEMLEHLSPWDYQEIRMALGHGSGFDSPGFNRLRQEMPVLVGAFRQAVTERDIDLVELYQRGYELSDLYHLAELVLELDELISMWRHRHVKVIERIIGGHVLGTQGTPVQTLHKLLDHKYVPELWQVRDRLTDLAGTSPAPPRKDDGTAGPTAD